MILLATVGLRILIEAVCLEEEITGHTLQIKIDNLAAEGHLSKKQAEFLHEHRFLGNDAAHKIKAPQPEILIAAIDIAETLLKTIYILPEIVKAIKSHKK